HIEPLNQMSWLDPEIVLTGEIIQMLPLSQTHFPSLKSIAADKKIWQFYVFDGSEPGKFEKVLESALEEKVNKNQYPFTIILRSSGKVVGSTRLMNIQPEHRKIEIGFTWFHPDYWGSAVNIESKLLLLTYCFEKLTAVRVQFRTDENNIRSRKAIEKIGGKFEGVIRNDMLRENGTRRNSAYYSIIEDEWKEIKKMLQTKLEDFLARSES
ncbi:MAG TPA: GNAT family N-acetyltransferase, partial [Puia sp.]|nr:GNAT family N-acetyltransferase [Puia sp.]